MTDDPCEQNNLAETQADLLKQLETTLAMYKATVVPPGNKPFDTRADPARWNNIWVPWYDELDRENAAKDRSMNTSLISPTAVVYVLIILTVALGVGAIAVKQCVLSKEDESNDLPEVNKGAGSTSSVYPGQMNQAHDSKEELCFDNVVCSS